MLIQMECKQCDFRPGEATVPHVAARAALVDYTEIGNRHAFVNEDHTIVMRIDGEPRRVNWISMKNVTCDQCFESVPKPDCDIRDGLIICWRCSSTDPCRCGHTRRRHTDAAGCTSCLICTSFEDAS